MKKLVVYYSLDGNTRYIAENIASAVGADILELKPVSDIKNNKFTKYLWGGKQVVMGQKPELEKISVNPLEYDTIFIGTPVWAFSFSPAINTFLSEFEIREKKLALFICDGGSKGKTFSNMRERLKDNTILGELELMEPIKGNEDKAAQAREWAEAMIKE
jgi:flavodoxin